MRASTRPLPILLPLALTLTGCQARDTAADDTPVTSAPILERSVSDAMVTPDTLVRDGTAIDHSVPPEPKPLITLDQARPTEAPKADAAKADASRAATPKADPPKAVDAPKAEAKTPPAEPKRAAAPEPKSDTKAD